MTAGPLTSRAHSTWESPLSTNACASHASYRHDFFAHSPHSSYCAASGPLLSACCPRKAAIPGCRLCSDSGILEAPQNCAAFSVVRR